MLEFCRVGAFGRWGGGSPSDAGSFLGLAWCVFGGVGDLGCSREGGEVGCCGGEVATVDTDISIV